MGSVYRARDTQLGREVALKVLLPAFAKDPDRLARFKREAQLLASLNHPHIGWIYGVEEGALVLEYVDGPTLADRIAGGALPIDEALSIADQIADALEAAHAQGMVHRDLKPANIKVRSDDWVKVLDFGLAKSMESIGLDSDAANSPTFTAGTRDGVILGTAAYMSPEQARGKAVDKRADVWAFGCILYEMITGRSAFGRETATDTIAAVVTAEVDWARLPSSTPPAVRRALRRCLEKDPKRRLRDIGDARLDIEEAHRETPHGPDTPRLRRFAIPAVAIGLAAGVVLTGTAVALVLHSPSSSVAAPDFSRVVRLTSGPDREVAPAISPDGKWVVYVSDAGGAPNVWVKSIAGGEPANLTGSTDLEIGSGTGIGGLEISPDGTRVAVMARQRGNVRYATWEIPAPLPGKPRKLLDDNFLGMRWSPDGKHITFISAGAAAGDGLWVADADGGNRREILPPVDGMHIHWPSWSDDGYIYFLRTFSTVINLDQTEIFRVDSNGGRPMEPVVKTLRRAQHPVPLRQQRGLIYSANPFTAEMRLWWRSADGKLTRQIVPGVGDYAEPSASADGATLVCTLYDLRQSLTRVALKPAGVMSPLTDGYHGDLDPMLSPRGDQIVFSSSRDGNRHIWVARVDGTDVRPLTSGSSEDDRPAYSPDGQQIAFASIRGGSRGIWIIAADGGSPRKLVDVGSTVGLTWSRDGQFVVYSAAAGSGPGLFKVSSAGGVPQRIPTPFFASEPVSSPTRDLIAYILTKREGAIATSTLAFVDVNGNVTHFNLADPPGGNGFANGTIAWAPDGHRLAVTRQVTLRAAELWIVDLDAAQPYTKILEFPIGPRVRGMTWSADGTHIIIGKHDWTSDIVLIDSGK